MLKKEQDPIQTMIKKVCEHAPATIADDKPNPEHVQILVSPKAVPGHDALVGQDYPLVAFVELGCLDPARNSELPAGYEAVDLHAFFVADEYIGGRDGTGRVQIGYEKTLAMLPWYEWAIGEYLLPDGWTIRDWVFTNEAGNSVPYVNGILLYPDGSWSGVDDPDTVLRNFELAGRRVNGFVNEVVKGGGKRSDIDITDYASAMAAMRNINIPEGIEKTAMDYVFGHGHGERDAKATRQALTAFMQAKLGVPIRVFEPVYDWPSN